MKVTRRSWFADVTVELDPYDVNLPVADLRAALPVVFAAAVAADGHPPRSFGGGFDDLPPFTASGLDPATLLRIPWGARHYAAAVESRAEIFRLFDDAAGDPDFTLDHPGRTEAIERCRRWASGLARPIGGPTGGR